MVPSLGVLGASWPLGAFLGGPLGPFWAPGAGGRRRGARARGKARVKARVKARAHTWTKGPDCPMGDAQWGTQQRVRSGALLGEYMSLRSAGRGNAGSAHRRVQGAFLRSAQRGRYRCMLRMHLGV